MLTAVKNVLQIREDGLMGGGPPCGPWVFINSATHDRKKDPAHMIFGDTTKSYVQASNQFLSPDLLTFFVGCLKYLYITVLLIVLIFPNENPPFYALQ